MTDLASFLGVLSGLEFLAPDLPLGTLVPTLLVVNTCDAFMCRLFARNNGYPPLAWWGIGLVFGIWAVAALILLPKRDRATAASADG